MRAERVEGAVARLDVPQGILANFSPAILAHLDDVGCVSYRAPRWFAVRFGAINERLTLRLLDLIDLPYHIFTYTHQVGRKRATTRSWLPGYMFSEFDVLRDDWGQLLRVPGMIEVLGAPTPLAVGVVEDLVERLPKRLERNTADAVVSVGSEVRITDGTFRGHTGKVTQSRRGRVTVLWMMFGHLREIELRVEDVEIIG